MADGREHSSCRDAFSRNLSRPAHAEPRRFLGGKPSVSWCVASFAPAHVASGCFRQATQPAPAGMCSLPLILPYRAPCGSLIRRFQLLTLAGLLMQSFSATASIPERLPKPPGSRETICCRFYFSTDVTDSRRFKTSLSPPQVLGSPPIPYAPVSSAQMSAASFQSAQFSVAPARESDHGLPGLAVKKAKLKQARLRKFSFLKATFVQRMRPRAESQF